MTEKLAIFRKGSEKTSLLVLELVSRPPFCGPGVYVFFFVLLNDLVESFEDDDFVKFCTQLFPKYMQTQ